jgi:hypothetical protein
MWKMLVGMQARRSVPAIIGEISMAVERPHKDGRVIQRAMSNVGVSRH